MTAFNTIIPALILAIYLGGCGAPKSDAPVETSAQTSQATFETLAWEDLMPEGEDEVLSELYADFYEEREKQILEQLPLSQAAQAQGDVTSLIDEGSAQDSMEQIGTYNVVDDLNGLKVRLPGYVVPLDFSATSEYTEFLLVPYFGACLHTPPPPPNQIVFVKSTEAAKIADINEPVWVEGVMKTGQFGSDLGNSAYELNLTTLKPYEY